MLSSALTFARRANVVLAPSERSHEFRNFLAEQLSFRPRALGRLNTSEPAARAAHLPAFRSATGLINSINGHEREFYDFVCESFNELRTKAHPTTRFSSGRRFAGITSRLPSHLVASVAGGPN